METKYIVAIEIGSSKIKGAIGSVSTDGEINILAVEEEKINNIVRYGCILNVAEVSDVIGNIIERLEKCKSVLPNKIISVYVSLGGRSLTTIAQDVQKQLPDEIEITESVIAQIMETARMTAIADKDVIDVKPRVFFVDKRQEINPVGVLGSEVVAKLNLIACRPQIRRNLNIVICERLKLMLNGCIVRPIAIADIVLNENEKRLGCLLVDFGAETTTVSIYKSGALQYLVTLPMGSRNITRDITAINCIEERAEEIKKAIDCSVANDATKKFLVDGVDSAEVNNFVQARVNEIILNIIAQVENAGFKIEDLPSGIIVVGGGAKLKGFNSILKEQSRMPVRSGAIIGPISILDSHISSSDSIDVIAILVAAARKNPVECFEKIEQYSTQTDFEEDTIEDKVDEEDEEDEEYPEQGDNSKPGYWQKIKAKIKATTNKVIEKIENEDDDDYDDDNDD